MPRLECQGDPIWTRPQEFSMGRFPLISRCSPSLSLPHGGRPARLFIYLLFVVVALAMWVRFLSFPTLVGGTEGNVDESWNQAYGYFLKNEFQAGKDYIFTYGPLAYFHSDATL